MTAKKTRKKKCTLCGGQGYFVKQTMNLKTLTWKTVGRDKCKGCNGSGTESAETKAFLKTLKP